VKILNFIIIVFQEKKWSYTKWRCLQLGQYRIWLKIWYGP